MSSCRSLAFVSFLGGLAVGSSKVNQWERAGKLLASALKLVLDGSRDIETWADHLHVFVFGQIIKMRNVMVNYDDPAHRRIDRDQYVCLADSLRPEHFPVRGKGQYEMVTCEYLECDHELTTKEVLAIIEGRSDIRLPDFAETRHYLWTYPQERMVAPIISLCGVFEVRGGEHDVSFLCADEGGLNLGWSWFGDRWDQRHCRFLVVRKLFVRG